MKISTRGRYALRVMVDLAINYDSGYISLKEIANRQDIPLKYIESIMTLLSKNNLVDAKHGKGGGYKLVKEAKDYKISDILTITEETLAPVSCLQCKENTCKRKEYCKTLPMWQNLYQIIKGYFDSITLESLISNNQPSTDALYI